VTIRLVLVDDHPIVLQGLQHLFERQGDFEVVSCCSDIDTALAAIETLRPDVLVADLRLPGRSGLELLRRVAEVKLGCRTIVLTASISSREVAEAVQLGARGIVLKESSPEGLVDCVRRVHAGETSIDPATLTAALQSVSTDVGSSDVGQTLTARELEIVRMVARGLRNKAIAVHLSITEGTVKVHLHNIYEKLGVSGRLELVLSAQEKGLV